MKRVIVLFLLCAGAFASVLETNDVKMNTLLGLGGNPAVIAVNKKVNFETGTVAMNRLSQNSRLLNGGDYKPLQGKFDGTHDGRNQNDMNYNDASKFFWFAGNIGDNWFGVRHTNISNVYPYGTVKLDLDQTGASKVTQFQKDTVESFSLLWARELTKGYFAGVELASNTYTLNEDKLYNTAAENLPGLFAQKDSRAFSISRPYYTLTLGLVKELNEVSKLSFAHKLSQDRGIYKNNDAGSTTVFNESMPNETGLSYIYKVNDAWEVAGVYKAFWGVSYTKNTIGVNGDSTDKSDTITKYPYTSLGFATDYKPNDKWTIQTYGNFIRNYKKMETVQPDTAINTNQGTMDRGYNVTQIGGNVQYHLNVIKGGTILLGTYVTKLQSEDTDKGYLFDITNTTLSYSQNF